MDDPNETVSRDPGTVASSDSAVNGGAEEYALIYDARQPEAVVQSDLMQFVRKDFHDLFVPTEAFSESANILREDHALVVTGAPGSGKSFISQQLLRKFCDEEQCNPFQPNVPDDYKNWLNIRNRQVFLMDDVFGASNFNESQYLAWSIMFPKMVQHLRSLNTFLIFTCRENILKGRLTALKATEIFNNVINLSDAKFQMTAKNKEDIFENHTKKFSIDIRYRELRHVCSLGTDPIGFPQRVRLFCSMKNVSKETRMRYFNFPMEFLSTIIGSYREADHVAYCVLILLLLNDDQLPISYLTHSNKSSELVQQCMDICDISSSTMGALRNKADSLCGSFLLLTNDRYVYQHPSVLEAVTLDFGQRYPSEILSLCSVQFLEERVFTRDSVPADNEYVVILQPVMFPQLCDRLVKEIAHYVNDQNAKLLIERHTFKWLSSYRVFKDDSFIKVFLRHLQDTGKFRLIFTSAIYDSPHLTFVFLAALSGQDALVQEVFSSYLRDVQQLSGCMSGLDDVLYAACNSGSLGAVKVLLGAGALVDYRIALFPDDVLCDHWRCPPYSTTFMHAAYSNNVEVLCLVCDSLQQQVDVLEYINLRDNRGWTVMHWWAKGGSGAAALQFLVKAGADVNMKNDAGCTVLYSAANLGDEATCRLLLKTGADMNMKDETDRTALYVAAEHGDECICRLLLETGADVNVTTNSGETSLHISAARGHGAISRLLVEAGADLHIIASNSSPLQEAFSHGNDDIANFIFGSMQSDLANTINFCSSYFFFNHIVTQKTGSSNKYDIILQPNTFHLLCRRLVVCIEGCLKQGTFLSKRQHDFYSGSRNVTIQSLSSHAVFRDAVFIRVFILHLLETDAFHLLSEMPCFAMTPIQKTSDSLCSSFPLLSNDIYRLLSVDDVVKLDFGRRNPSQVLGRWSVQFLLKHVFTQDSAPPDDEFIIILQPVMFPKLISRLVTEITNCVHNENTKAMRSLASYRVFIDDAFTRVLLRHMHNIGAFHLLFTSASSDSQHPSFMLLAAVSGQDVLIHEVFSTYIHDVRRHFELSGQLSQVLYAACYSGSLEAIRVLLAAGAQADYRMAHAPDHVRDGWWSTSQTCTTMMHAAYSNNAEVLLIVSESLKQQHVNVAEYIDIRDSIGRTVIHWWAMGGHDAASLQFIIKAAANVNVKDTAGHTVLYCAAEQGNEAICRLLLDVGANVNARSNDGRTALHVSIGRGHSVITRLLVEAGADLHIRASGNIPLDVAILHCNRDIADFIFVYLQQDLTNTINRCSDNFLLCCIFTEETCPPKNRFVIVLQPTMFPLLCERLVMSIERYLKKEVAYSPDRSPMPLSCYAVFGDATFTQVFLLHLIQTNTFHLLSEIIIYTMVVHRNAPASLCTSFPLLSNDRYKHLSVVDIVTLDFGRRNPSNVLDRWSVHFLLTRVFTPDSAPPDNEFVIILKPEMFQQLISRLEKEITNCVIDQNAKELRYVSAYIVFKDHAFTQAFLLHMHSTDAFRLLFTSASSDSQHPTFLFLAAVSGQSVLFQTVVSSYMRDVREIPAFRRHLNRVLYAACYSGSVEIVRELLAVGARVDYRLAHAPDHVRDGRWSESPTCTALMHAAYSNNEAVLRIVCECLQQQHVNVAEYIDIRDSIGRTAIHWWAMGGHDAASLQFIIKTGANINAKDTSGHTVLYCTAERGDEAICRLLLDDGADVNVMINDGRSALHVSTERGHSATIRLLAEAGADLNKRVTGQSPLDVAILKCNSDTEDYFFSCMQKDLANTINNCSNDFLLRHVFTEQTRPPKSRNAIILQSELFPLLCARLIKIIEIFLNRDNVRFLNRENVFWSIESRGNFKFHLKAELPSTSMQDLAWYEVLKDPAFADVFMQHLQKIDALKPLLTSASFDSQHHEFIFGPGRLYDVFTDVIAFQRYNTRGLP